MIKKIKQFPEKKYFRLAPGKEVRLRHAFNITCEKLIKDNNGEILELECTYDPISRDMSKGNKVKGMIHWVDANNCIDAQINVYDRLFLDSLNFQFADLKSTHDPLVLAGYQLQF